MKNIALEERITVLFSISTVLTPAPAHMQVHICRTPLNGLVLGWWFASCECVAAFSFFYTHCCYLIQFLCAGTQTCCQHHHHHLCLDILEPPENDVLMFLSGREETEGGGVVRAEGPLTDCFSHPVCPSIYVRPFLIH